MTLPDQVRATGGPVRVLELPPIIQSALLILHAVDAAGGQGRALDGAVLWEAIPPRRPGVTWAHIKRLRAAVAAEIDAAASRSAAAPSASDTDRKAS